MKKKIAIGFLLMVLIVCLAIAFKFKTTFDEADAITFETVNLQTIEDGKYQGSCDIGLVKVKLVVYIQHHRIEKVSILEHENGLGNEAERIIDRMVEENRLDVDTISGATISSKAIHKAIEKALIQGDYKGI